MDPVATARRNERFSTTTERYLMSDENQAVMLNAAKAYTKE